MSQSNRILLALATAATAILAFLNASRWDGGEEAGGQFTGPSIIASFFTAPILLIGTGLLFKFPKTAFAFTMAGAIMALPLILWDMFPGWICSFGSCLGEPPIYVLSYHSVAMIFLLAISLLGQMRGVRK
jgi:hypothetical protein